MTVLARCEEADFLFLQRLTGLSKGNLSVHLSKLEAAGLVEIRKEFVGKKPRTVIRINEAGADAVMRHWQRLDSLRHMGEALGQS